MDILLRGIIGFLLAIILHELTHLLIIIYYKIPFKAVVLTKWSAMGFLVENEHYINNRKILVLLHFLPLIWCILVFFDPNEPFFIMFPLVNISGGIGDFYYYLRIVSLPSEKRIEWANKMDEKILGSIIWKYDLKR
jgi:hypothetical protein